MVGGDRDAGRLVAAGIAVGGFAAGAAIWSAVGRDAVLRPLAAELALLVAVAAVGALLLASARWAAALLPATLLLAAMVMLRRSREGPA